MESADFTFGGSDSDEDAGAPSEEPVDETKPSASVSRSKLRSTRRLFVENKKEKKNIDAFLSKIKEEQTRRMDEGITAPAAPIAPVQSTAFALEHDDPMSTNLFVGDLVRSFRVQPRANLLRATDLLATKIFP